MGNPNPVGNPKGRPKGSLNKTTAHFKDAVNKILDDCAPEMKDWFSELTAKERFDVLCRLAEYCYPKLARQELTGADGEKLSVSIAINGIVRERADKKELGAASDAGAVPRV